MHSHRFALVPLVMLAACGAAQSPAAPPPPAAPAPVVTAANQVNWSALPFSATACRVDADCVLGRAFRPVSSTADCYCGPRCGQGVVNRQTHDASEASYARYCTTPRAVAAMACPQVDCAFGPGRPQCRSGRCTGDS